MGKANFTHVPTTRVVTPPFQAARNPLPLCRTLHREPAEISSQTLALLLVATIKILYFTIRLTAEKPRCRSYLPRPDLRIGRQLINQSYPASSDRKKNSFTPHSADYTTTTHHYQNQKSHIRCSRSCKSVYLLTFPQTLQH
jgi:hypothetical protein